VEEDEAVFGVVGSNVVEVTDADPFMTVPPATPVPTNTVTETVTLFPFAALPVAVQVSVPVPPTATPVQV